MTKDPKYLLIVLLIENNNILGFNSDIKQHVKHAKIKVHNELIARKVSLQIN